MELREKIADILDDGYSWHSDILLCGERDDYAGCKPYVHTDRIMNLIELSNVEAQIEELKYSYNKGYFIPEMEVYADNRLAELEQRRKELDGKTK